MTNLDASAKNMQAVCKAKEAHDKSCPWGGTANRVHLSWFDLERIGWEEGDVICGLIVVGYDQVATGMMRVSCDAEPGGGKEESEEEVVEAVVRPRARDYLAVVRAFRPALISSSRPNASLNTSASFSAAQRAIATSSCASSRSSTRPFVDLHADAVDRLIARALELLGDSQHGRAARQHLLVAVARRAPRTARASGCPCGDSGPSGRSARSRAGRSPAGRR